MITRRISLSKWRAIQLSTIGKDTLRTPDFINPFDYYNMNEWWGKSMTKNNFASSGFDRANNNSRYGLDIY